MYLRVFLPKQGQGFNPPAVHLYPNIGRVPAGFQSRSLVKWAIKLRSNAQGFQWIAHKLKAIGQNIKANGKKALRIIDYIIDYKERHGQLSSKDQSALLSS